MLPYWQWIAVDTFVYNKSLLILYNNSRTHTNKVHSTKLFEGRQVIKGIFMEWSGFFFSFFLIKNHLKILYETFYTYMLKSLEALISRKSKAFSVSYYCWVEYTHVSCYPVGRLPTSNTCNYPCGWFSDCTTRL